MKLICPYVPDGLKAETAQAIKEHWPGYYDFVRLNPDDYQSYPKLLARLWKEQESFFIVEQDIVIRWDVSEGVLGCGCLYGAFPYPWLTDVGPALGCTWFYREFISQYPEVMETIMRMNIAWNQLDVVLMRHLLVREHHQQPHVHVPPVEHLNELKRLMPSANPNPLTSLPAW